MIWCLTRLTSIRTNILQVYITVGLPCVRMEQEVCLHCVFFNVNLWLTGLDTVVHSSCLMTVSRSLQFVAKSFPKLLRLISICINTWQIFAVAFLWTTVHYVWWLWLRSSLVGWVGLFCRLVSWVGLGCVHQLLGWVGLDHRKWTHVHVWANYVNIIEVKCYRPKCIYTHVLSVTQFNWKTILLLKVKSGQDSSHAMASKLQRRQYNSHLYPSSYIQPVAVNSE